MVSRPRAVLRPVSVSRLHGLENFGLGLGLESCSLGLGLGLEPSGLGLGLEGSGLVNIPEWSTYWSSL